MKLSPDLIIDGKYRILRCLGQGGMGAVYLGENTRIGRRVAIKVLHADLAGQSTPMARFQMEAQLTSRIGSAHIVDVLDMGDLADGHCFLVMEYLEGETLAERIERRGSLPPDELSALAMQALDGLGKAHAARIIHRDMKPDNIFLTRRDGGDFVKLVDFGVSKFLEDARQQTPTLTVDGTLVGTPAYMSPEQARGMTIDARTDLYALGIVLYECLAGDTPFSGENVQDVLFRVALEKPPRLDPGVIDVDPAFIAIVHRAIERSADDRFQSAEEFYQALSDWRISAGLSPDGTSPRPRAPSLVSIPAPPATPPQPSPPVTAAARADGTPATWSTVPTALETAPVDDAEIWTPPAPLWRRVLPAVAAAGLLGAGLYFGWPAGEAMMQRATRQTTPSSLSPAAHPGARTDSVPARGDAPAAQPAPDASHLVLARATTTAGRSGSARVANPAEGRGRLAPKPAAAKSPPLDAASVMLPAATTPDQAAGEAPSPTLPAAVTDAPGLSAAPAPAPAATIAPGPLSPTHLAAPPVRQAPSITAAPRGPHAARVTGAK